MALSSPGNGTILDVLSRQAERRPDAPFLVFESPEGSVSVSSYIDMHERAMRTAIDLLERGVGSGDTVHVHLPNCPEFFDCWFGAAAIGAVMVPTNPLLTGDELAYVVGHARCRLSLTHPDLIPAVSAAQSSDRIVVAGRAVGPVDASAAAELVEVDPSAVAAVMYTSGTTSRPKGVLVTHANYLNAGEAVAQHLRMRYDDRWLVVLPLFHAKRAVLLVDVRTSYGRFSRGYGSLQRIALVGSGRAPFRNLGQPVRGSHPNDPCAAPRVP